VRVLERVEEFKLNNLAGEEVWFRELLLCILTSNSSFVSAYIALNAIIPYVFNSDINKISKILKNSRYRFYNIKAKYIYEAKKFYGNLKSTVKPIADKDQFEAREFILNNFLGLGMKESSHFLRNVGYFNLAIIDRHVMNFLYKNAIIESNIIKLNKTRYLYYESFLRSIATSVGYEVGVLDLFIWFHETGTLLK
jgi:N-glycosylase/DNA lyase